MQWLLHRYSIPAPTPTPTATLMSTPNPTPTSTPMLTAIHNVNLTLPSFMGAKVYADESATFRVEVDMGAGVGAGVNVSMKWVLNCHQNQMFYRKCNVYFLLSFKLSA